MQNHDEAVTIAMHIPALPAGGLIEDVGKIATLLLLQENPLAAIEAWDSIETVILHGEAIKRESLAALIF